MLVAQHRFFSKCRVKLISLTFNGLRATNINPNKNDGLPVKITGYLMVVARHRFFSKCRVEIYIAMKIARKYSEFTRHLEKIDAGLQA
jgi:hypothetical protein